ncbi:MAG: winged helix-turn-helix transcriptional regulator [SAR324 cluster bacterium]|nr:winged helix-turn-helix transcriptional regulator [SAR324 cluster bacterium]
MTGSFQIDETLKESLEILFGRRAERIEKAARCLKVFAHPARMKILCVLRVGECSVLNLSNYTGIEQAPLSQHLSLLKDRGIVVSRRSGNYVLYSLANDQMSQLFEMIQEIYCKD